MREPTSAERMDGLVALLRSAEGANTARRASAPSFITIYGADDRREIQEIQTPKVQEHAMSVAAIFGVHHLTPDGDFYQPKTETLTQRFNFHPEERFSDQVAGATATAFVVGKRRIATAGHCVAPNGEGKILFAFGYRLMDDGRPRILIPRWHVYSCVRIVDRHLDPLGADWAVVEVDRDLHVPPLPIRRRPVVLGEPVYYMGHPRGLPLKHVGCAKVVDATPRGFFLADTDTFKGSSGSPVFDEHHEVVGIHVRGCQEHDGAKDGVRSIHVDTVSDKFPGQSVTRITELTAACFEE